MSNSRTIQDSRIEKILYTNSQIRNKIKKLAVVLNHEYKHKNPILVGILKGCLPFFNELFMQLTCDPIADFMVVSSYRDSTKAVTMPKIVTDLRQNIYKRHVIIVEDIIDSGETIKSLNEILCSRKPQSLKIACLLDKSASHKVKLDVDYACFKNVPSKFVVGFGLDYAEKMRNLPYIGILKKTVYA
jgi:hypoxanthine phosphoribosyltransferase